MKQDEYGTVLNSKETYKAIASYLMNHRSVLIAWTDEEGTQLDILFNLGAGVFGTPQGGVEATDLFVSIMRFGSFGFEIDNQDTHASYYEEKLAGRNLGSTADKLAELINGIKKELI